MQEQPVANVRWGEWISEGWQMFADKWQVWVLQMLIVFLVFAVPSIPLYLTMLAMPSTAEPGQPPEFPPMFFPMFGGMGLLALLAGPFLISGLYKTAFKQLRGEPISVGDLFSGGDIFLRVLGSFFAMGFFVILGFLLCILPSYVAMGLLFFTVPLIVERDLSIGEALSTSYNTVKSNWFMFTLFVFVLGILASVGSFACYVGLLATYPLHFTVTAIAYRDVFGVAGARSFLNNQPQYPTNYAPQAFPPPQSLFETPSQQEATASICPNCGTQIVRAARFCSKCGASIGA
ncbi:MAG: zinc-ribbon domain-containing protein [Acidobacteriota bacterium]|nr:zinc-ribbon domain-containing protein [Acidobacteriota bacterium]